MCRIAGIYNFNESISENEIKQLKSASNSMKMGGPDNEGILKINHKLALLHRRLSIIDTSNASNQPFFDTSGKFCIIFNGEIFNYKQLYSEKLSEHKLNTHSDTEVLLYLIIQYGTACLDWLSGFFSFAYYDIENDYLLIVRDRIGKKPLIYYKDNDTFKFSSEMKGLIDIGIPKQIDSNSLYQYLRFTFIPSPHTIFKNTYKLEQGHYLEIKNNKITISRYYETKLNISSYNKIDYTEAKSKLKQLVYQSVEERLISDVPLGAFLSGGIDSSIIATVASKFTNNLNTFSIGYKDYSYYDETKYARLVSNKINTKHEVFYLTDKDFKDSIFPVLESIDEPFGDSSCIPLYILSKKVSKHIKVALSGDGGDEIFSGYNRHKAEFRYRFQSGVLKSIKPIAPILNIIPSTRTTPLGNYIRKAKKFIHSYDANAKERYLNLSSFTNKQEVDLAFSNSFQNSLNNDILKNRNTIITNYLNNNSDFNEYLLTDLNFILVSDMLHKVDMMSMANSLEVRSPLLDYRIIDYAFSLPHQYKIGSNFAKKILIDTFKDDLPVELFNRTKHGFEIPLMEFFKNDIETYIFEELLNKNDIEEQNIFNYEYILNLRKKLHSKNNDQIYVTIWSIVVFQYWYNKYVK